MAETVNQVQTETNGNGNSNETPAKTFTQAEVDAIVEGRLQRERAKYADYDSLKDKAGKYDAQIESEKTDLQKATERAAELEKELNGMKHAETVRGVREKVAKEKGVPVNLLTADTEEACKTQADAILEFAQPSGYPTVKDGGETKATGKKSTADLFADWFNGL